MFVFQQFCDQLCVTNASDMCFLSVHTYIHNTINGNVPVAIRVKQEKILISQLSYRNRPTVIGCSFERYSMKTMTNTMMIIMMLTTIVMMMTMTMIMTQDAYRIS